MTARAAGRTILTVAVVIAIASAVVNVVQGHWEATFRFAVVTVLMLAPRAADVPAPFAGVFAAFLLLATWASVEHWYREITHFDTFVHVLTPGSLAAAATTPSCTGGYCRRCGMRDGASRAGHRSSGWPSSG